MATIRCELVPGGQLPKYMTSGAAGMDMYARLPMSLVFRPGDRVVIPCGFKLELPPGLQGEVRSRSGWALRDGIIVVNSPGTIDSDFRGEVAAILAHNGRDTVSIHPGDRIAQLVIMPATQVSLELVDTITATARGEGGFGSTG